MNVTRNTRSLAALTALGLTLTGFFFAAPTVTAYICEPVIGEGTSECGLAPMVCGNLNVVIGADASGEAGTIVAEACRAMDPIGPCTPSDAPWQVEGGAASMGPLDSVIIELTCETETESDHVATCTANFILNPCIPARGTPEITGLAYCHVDPSDNPNDGIPLIGSWGDCHIDP